MRLGHLAMREASRLPLQLQTSDDDAAARELEGRRTPRACTAPRVHGDADLPPALPRGPPGS